MINMNAEVINFPKRSKSKTKGKARKTGLNKNKEGSVRKVNGKVYVDFIYMEERVRENSGLPWNKENSKHVRELLDKIIVNIKSGEFRYAKVFLNSRKADYFTEKELSIFGGNKPPEQVLFHEYVWIWYDLLKDSERVEPRTLWGYKSYIQKYLIPYFGNLSFADMNKSQFDKFISWSKKQKYRGKPISNSTVNKIFVPLKMMCKDVAIEYGWGSEYNPFFGFKRVPKEDTYEHLSPFSMEEQKAIITALPDHWKPYFLFAFSTGVRQGEQIGIKPDDINWSEKTLKISRAFTRDENGKVMVGKTKNRFSRRIIKLIPVMYEALEMQRDVFEKHNCDYFFCSTTGKRVDRSHLRQRVWMPSLERAGVKYREIKQTRHSFATNALSCGESPLWIAKVMGHRDTDMIIRVYGKYIEDAGRIKDGNKLDSMYQKCIGKEK